MHDPKNGLSCETPKTRFMQPSFAASFGRALFPKVSQEVYNQTARKLTFSNGELDALALGKGDPRLAVLSNDKDVGQPGGELAV